MGYIHYQLLRSRKAEDLMEAYKETIKLYKGLGVKPKFQRLDNETSNLLEDYFKEEGIEFQYAVPHSHQSNIAERAIRTAKNHLLSVLATSSDEFPRDLWDQAIPQAELTLNHLVSFKPDPSKSAYHGLHGRTWDFMAHPIAPFGTKVCIYVSTDDRLTWDYHGLPGFYLGPANLHYRAFRVYVISTESERVAESLDWFPVPYKMPGAAPEDAILMILDDLEKAIMNITTNLSYPNISEEVTQRIGPESTAESVIKPIRTLMDMYFRKSDDAIGNIGPTLERNELPSQDIRTTNTEYISPSIPLEESDPKVDGRWSTRGQDGEYDEDYVPERNQEKTRTDLPMSESEPERDGNFITGNTRSQQRKRRRLANQAARAQSVHLTSDKPTQKKLVTEDWRDLPSKSQWSFAGATVLDELTGSPLKYAHLRRQKAAAKWLEAEHTEFVRLITGTGTMKFIKPGALPRDRTASYYNPQPEIKIKEGKEVYRIRGTYGGDRGDPYDEDKSAYVADATTVKCLLNKVVSTAGAKFMTLDIKDFYLGTDLRRKQYMRIHRRMIPKATMSEFGIYDPTYWRNDYILVEISKGIYGLPEAGKLAQERLYKHLAEHGYVPAENTTGLLSHKTRDTYFTLVVDDFGVYYTDAKDVEYLIETLQKLYEITIDWTGTKYLGLTINHDIASSVLCISMPDYIAKALIRFDLDQIQRAVHSPMKYTRVRYSSAPQVTVEDKSGEISAERKKRIEQIVGVILYYSRMVDPTMLTSVNKIASRQAKPTREVEEDAIRLLQYANTYPVAITVFRASDMKLRIVSDASYNSESIARSRAGGYHDLVKNAEDPYLEAPNGAILCVSSLIDCVVASAAEAEYAALFMNAQQGAIIRATLEDMGCKQEVTPIYTDNKCAEGIANETITLQKSKSMDMRFHWVRDRVRQQQFQVIWREGLDNIADYFTKTHPTAHYKMKRDLYVLTPTKEEFNSSKGVLMAAYSAIARYMDRLANRRHNVPIPVQLEKKR